LGAKGMEQILYIMDHLRDTKIDSFGEFIVREKIDRRDGEPQPHLSRTDSSARNMLIYYMEDTPDTTGMRMTVRPSGTEPKIKMYFEVLGKPFKLENIDSEKESVIKIYFEIEDDITNLKSISDNDERKKELFRRLEFLGANPIEKVNKAFQAKYKKGILEYLELS
jgi:phosphomannomutase